ncbi:hypothetical protein AAJ76_2900015300 [Vairimorpha ceranae]|uniref:Uncharacterized protein n=1 Tax=Vairimorpha ceranae TaxID=40302 RepID=A0A0F9WCF2_9MICR|nr:hypothetical protein AAJ76_2900015300 [Vairimorpha ceranae]KKO75176.1 hypothetical protein AAJ76_2900015300 [Vairimorpha ceranae]
MVERTNDRKIKLYKLPLGESFTLLNFINKYAEKSSIIYTGR